ncbi:hypothetical protein CcrColossus_gp436 [Caulobacter phage CcrColossus]|uniref:Uncharacterized protein n=1 Tax=Caulobacter phage CcrColossus TaxID=1211640 RepID=K4JT43_9CAUD|nr:hypothetical protein CcrColossus_gp436 [Caulobacter phage CcrColossus]AFU88306.1 hypothetical protein CcrColossus_gp436 [Caulobacter phage CcrColossus]
MSEITGAAIAWLEDYYRAEQTGEGERVPFEVLDAMADAIAQNRERGEMWQAKYAFDAMVRSFRKLKDSVDDGLAGAAPVSD